MVEAIKSPVDIALLERNAIAEDKHAYAKRVLRGAAQAISPRHQVTRGHFSKDHSTVTIFDEGEVTLTDEHLFGLRQILLGIDRPVGAINVGRGLGKKAIRTLDDYLHMRGHIDVNHTFVHLPRLQPGHNDFFECGEVDFGRGVKRIGYAVGIVGDEKVSGSSRNRSVYGQEGPLILMGDTLEGEKVLNIENVALPFSATYRRL